MLASLACIDLVAVFAGGYAGCADRSADRI